MLKLNEILQQFTVEPITMFSETAILVKPLSGFTIISCKAQTKTTLRFALKAEIFGQHRPY